LVVVVLLLLLLLLALALALALPLPLPLPLTLTLPLPPLRGDVSRPQARRCPRCSPGATRPSCGAGQRPWAALVRRQQGWGTASSTLSPCACARGARARPPGSACRTAGLPAHCSLRQLLLLLMMMMLLMLVAACVPRVAWGLQADE
jgi:hypothetical protein